MPLWHSLAMIIASRRYVAGRLTNPQLPLDGKPRGKLPPGTFDWIGLHAPDAAEMALLQAQFGLHPLAVEDALNPMQMPKVDAYGQQLFIVARTAAIEDGDKIAYGQTALFLGHDFVATVRFGSERDHSAVRSRLEAAAEHLIEGPDYVAHAILDFVVDGYHPIMERLEEAVQTIEERAIDAFPEPSTIRRIFRLRRQLRRFVRIVGPMEEVCERLSTLDLPVIDAGARVWYRDVLDHMLRTMRRIAGLNETLASVVETASLLEQHRQGTMTRQLAAWAAILAVPTAIAGIYGMNFDYMPELRESWGYPAVMTVIGLICGGLWLRFRQIDWL